MWIRSERDIRISNRIIYESFGPDFIYPSGNDRYIPEDNERTNSSPLLQAKNALEKGAYYTLPERRTPPLTKSLRGIDKSEKIMEYQQVTSDPNSLSDQKLMYHQSDQISLSDQTVSYMKGYFTATFSQSPIFPNPTNNFHSESTNSFVKILKKSKGGVPPIKNVIASTDNYSYGNNNYFGDDQLIENEEGLFSVSECQLDFNSSVIEAHELQVTAPHVEENKRPSSSIEHNDGLGFMRIFSRAFKRMIKGEDIHGEKDSNQKEAILQDELEIKDDFEEKRCIESISQKSSKSSYSGKEARGDKNSSPRFEKRSHSCGWKELETDFNDFFQKRQSLFLLSKGSKN